MNWTHLHLESGEAAFQLVNVKFVENRGKGLECMIAKHYIYHHITNFVYPTRLQQQIYYRKSFEVNLNKLKVQMSPQNVTL